MLPVMMGQSDAAPLQGISGLQDVLGEPILGSCYLGPETDGSLGQCYELSARQPVIYCCLGHATPGCK